MTLSTTAPIQSPVSSRYGPYLPPPLTTPSPPSERGYSDSVLPSCRMSADKLSQFSSTSSTATMTPTTEGTQACGSSQHPTIPLPRKAKHELRLSSFHEFGLATSIVHPTALLTPPDETTLASIHAPQASIVSLPYAISNPPSDVPTTIEDHDITPQPSHLPESGSSSRVVTVTTPHGHVSLAKAQKTPLEEPIGSAASPGTTFDDSINLASELQTSLDTRSTDCTLTGAASIAVSKQNSAVFNILCHTEPCPLASETNQTTAFNELVSNLQHKISYGSYIEITHAIPLGFSMGQVPHSPVVTPNPSSENEPADYFSIQNTFSKAVVATSYQDALESSVPSSPHPVVAPSTVHISLLERYTPPTMSYEFKDLFSSDAPSALVNRLTELSSDKGSLIFIYPTKAGAHTFNSDYLGPLLHPLLRRLTGIHGLTSDLGHSVAKIESLEHLLAFEDMSRKLDLLLRKLGRSSRSSASSVSAVTSYRPSPPKFEVIHRSARKVQLDRKSWQSWYLHQQKPRIQEIVGKYFKRGFRVPTETGVTAGSICREILQGLERQEYTNDSPPRDGVEVGVFVVQRTG